MTKVEASINSWIDNLKTLLKSIKGVSDPTTFALTNVPTTVSSLPKSPEKKAEDAHVLEDDKDNPSSPVTTTNELVESP